LGEKWILGDQRNILVDAPSDEKRVSFFKGNWTLRVYDNEDFSLPITKGERTSPGKNRVLARKRAPTDWNCMEGWSRKGDQQ